jgi:phosphonate transport system substrate-binding protein
LIFIWRGICTGYRQALMFSERVPTMKSISLIAIAVAASFLAGTLVCRHLREPGHQQVATAHPSEARGDPRTGAAIRIGIVPERDIFAQRRRYRVLMDHLETCIDQPIALVTVNTYQAILDDFAQRDIDAAFLGSMVAALTMDRLGAQVAVKPQMIGGETTYHGVLFVGPDSPIVSLDDLRGRTIAAVRTTTAGELFAMYAMKQAGLLDAPDAPRLTWVGTHDDVMMEVIAGRVDAGTVKDLRLAAYEASHSVTMRRFVEGPNVPNNALLIRADLGETLGPTLSAALLSMHETGEGRDALAAFGATRFVPCDAQEYAAVYDMIASLADAWPRMGIAGMPPRLRDGKGE